MKDRLFACVILAAFLVFILTRNDAMYRTAMLVFGCMPMGILLGIALGCDDEQDGQS